MPFESRIRKNIPRAFVQEWKVYLDGIRKSSYRRAALVFKLRGRTIDSTT